MNLLTVRQAILRTLVMSRPYTVPAETLLWEVNRLTRPATTADELRAHLSWLLDRNMIGFLPDELDPDSADARKWFIKEAGQAAIA